MSMRKIARIGTATVRRDSDSGEYVVTFDGNPKADYFTDDKRDAIQTARAEARRTIAMEYAHRDSIGITELMECARRLHEFDAQYPKLDLSIPEILESWARLVTRSHGAARNTSGEG